MNLTDAEYPVSWDWGDDPEQAPAFCARLELTPDGRIARWNGFVRPWLTRAEVERYRLWSDAQHAAGDVDCDRVAFVHRIDGADLLRVWDGYSDEDGPYTLEPVDGLYPLGAGYWTWTVDLSADYPSTVADAEDDWIASLHA